MAARQLCVPEPDATMVRGTTGSTKGVISDIVY